MGASALRVLSLVLFGPFLGGCAMAAGATAGALAGSVLNFVNDGVRSIISGPQKSGNPEDLAALNRQAGERMRQQTENQRLHLTDQQVQGRSLRDQPEAASIVSDEERLAIKTAQRRENTLLLSGASELTGTYRGQDDAKCDIVAVERASDGKSGGLDTMTYLVCEGKIASAKPEKPSSAAPARDTAAQVPIPSADSAVDRSSNPETAK